jgi:hypothetical protein
VIYLAEVKHFVINAERIFETALWHTALYGHLATFVTLFALVTCTGLLAFVTTGRSATMAATFTTTNTLWLPY